MSPSDFSPNVMLDGVLGAAGDARISPLGDGFMFGHGLFETIKVMEGRPVFFAEHVARLERSARELELTVGEGLRARCERVIAANALVTGVLKVALFAGASEVAGELILTREFFYPPLSYAAGFSLKTFPDARVKGGWGGLKTLNYLKNNRARAAARKAGYDEALFVDAAGDALEGAATNIFAVKDGRVVTPAARCGILPGIARGVVLRLATGIAVEEGKVDAGWLREADEVFVTNSLLGVMPVVRIDERNYAWNAEGLTGKIQATYCAAERRSLAEI